ncbi:hypothetical protein AM232_20715 [Bacillus sp. FJAT-21352]|nr:hypothetical protein AM232_20715 [Bacillus sp. FJAT-21352]
MPQRIWEGILTFVITGVLAFITNLGITYLVQKDISIITIGDSTKLEEKQFLHPVNISAFEDIENLRVRVPGIITEKEIKSNIPINIEIVKNNINSTSDSVFEITKIPADSNVELILITDQSLNDKEIVVNGNGNKVDVEYTSELKNPITGQIISIAASAFLNAFLYTIILGIITYFANKGRDKKIAEVTNKLNEIKEDGENSKVSLKEHLAHHKERSDQFEQSSNEALEKLELLSADLEKIQTNSMKKQILLQAKLNDYRKELNFWRNTIRKIIYQSPNGEKKAEKLMEIVSSSLKTYQTNEKQNHDFESLKVLSKIIKDIDED